MQKKTGATGRMARSRWSEAQLDTRSALLRVLVAAGARDAGCREGWVGAVATVFATHEQPDARLYATSSNIRLLTPSDYPLPFPPPPPSPPPPRPSSRSRADPVSRQPLRSGDTARRQEAASARGEAGAGLANLGGRRSGRDLASARRRAGTRADAFCRNSLTIGLEVPQPMLTCALSLAGSCPGTMSVAEAAGWVSGKKRLGVNVCEMRAGAGADI
eukprot:363257-Chlamydomonas_euryale.AAC.4